MAKKIVAIAIIVMMVLSVFAFVGCDGFNLANYKTTAKATIQTYALEKGLNNEYAEENWNIIERIVAQGEAAVDAANNKPTVDSAVTIAELAMDGIPTENEMAKILSEFDLTDSKELWNGTINDEFEIDRVVVIMKKTTTFPELELRHFALSNGARLEYDWLKPSSENTPEFRQILTIYLKHHGKDNVIAAISVLEKLDFVKIVQPEYIY